jgi:transcription elongation factor GreA
MKKENNINKLVLTADGYLALETKLNELKNVRRPEIIKALKEARAQGDLSENADYDAARNDQAQVEAKIKDLEYQRKTKTLLI